MKRKKYVNSLLMTNDKYLDKGFEKQNRRVYIIDENNSHGFAVVKLNSLNYKTPKINKGRLLPLGKNHGVAYGADINLYTARSDGNQIRVSKEFRPLSFYFNNNTRKKIHDHVFDNSLNKGISKKNKEKYKSFIK